MGDVTRTVIGGVTIALMLVACGDADTSSARSSPTGRAHVAIDPCALMPAVEASQLAGITFAAPAQDASDKFNVRTCVYGDQSLDVVKVTVSQAANGADLGQAKAQASSVLQGFVAQGARVTQLPTFADGATIVQGSATDSGNTVTISGITVLRGEIFFGFSDVAINRPVPDAGLLEREAERMLSRLP